MTILYSHPQPLKFLEIPEIVTSGCVDLIKAAPMVAAPKKVAKPRNVHDQA